MNLSTYKISILGNGNVAYHLAKAFMQANINLSYIYSRNAYSNEKDIFCNDLQKVVDKSDILIFAVSDSGIAEILQNINWNEKLLLHTAGSVHMNIFKEFSVNYGVFYPLQTFSKTRKLDYTKIPFLLEANNPKNLSILHEIASKISINVQEVNSEQRKNLHLAAVFVSNFSNHMLSIAQQITSEQNLNFELLKPLITETLTKSLELSPILAQTGPALRNDLSTINKHLDILSNKALWKKIYSFVSQSIYDTKINKHE